MNIDRLIKKAHAIVHPPSTGRKRQKLLACALDKKGRVLSIRSNDYECSHPLQKHFAELSGRPDAIYLHAEISALIAAKKDVYKMIVVRVDADGNPMLAKPCKICERAMKEYGVKVIEYTM